MSKKTVAVIGAGPAGLTAGYQLRKHKISVDIFEADPQYVGGISRTVKYKDYLFDIGGHRFFSKSKEIEDLWTEILPQDLLQRPRRSRIFYRNKFFSYPLNPLEALLNLGLVQSFMIVCSYTSAKLFPVKNPRTYSDWVSNLFGKRLFQIFFKTYTEKVWGMDCNSISADWAKQRIGSLSVSKILFSKFPNFSQVTSPVKSLIESFRYPRKGPGMLWEACAKRILEMGGQIHMGCKVTKVRYLEDIGKYKLEYQYRNGDKKFFEADHIISSIPIRELIKQLAPICSEATVQAASSLRYRDFLVVNIIAKGPATFTDNWIYIHDPNVKVGRIQNLKSWSPNMVPDQQCESYGLEYFCFDHDDLWETSDEELIELGKQELEALGLVPYEKVIDGCVVRQSKAYPVYDHDYKDNLTQIKKELRCKLPGLHLVGRNGMHAYNNQDHSMMTALLCVKNIVAGAELYDVWGVNQDAEYHEQVDEKEYLIGVGHRMVPKSILELDKKGVMVDL